MKEEFVKLKEPEIFLDINAWSKAGPAHHCAIGIGHIAHKIEKFAELVGISCEKVC